MALHFRADLTRRRPIALLWGVLCHVAFIIAIAMMIYSMYGGMQTGWGSLHGGWRWLGNALLILQFPLLHSFLLTPHGRRWLKRLAPAGFGEPLATTTYVLIASLQVMLLFALWSPGGTVWWEAHGPARLVLSLLYAAAWLLLFKSIADASLGLHLGWIGWRAVWRNTKPVYPPMPSTGVFRLCRQPIYLCFALTLWTVPVWTPDQLFLAVPLTWYCLVGPLLKEERFRKTYRGQFEDYQRRVPYWLPRPAPRAAREDRTSHAAHAQ
jgi:methanethiol S-methyltransferase